MTQLLKTLSGKTCRPYAFGTMQFGGTADESASRQMYEACREAGIRHFDTAHVYTGGASERILGALAAAHREDVFIATKCANRHGASARVIRREFDESRRRLGMDCVDLLYLHRWDGETDLAETFGALAELRAEGAIRHIGVSNFAAWQVMKAQAVAARLGCRIDVIQPMYNLVKRQAEVELLPMCQSEGLLAACYSPLGGGILSGKYGAPDATGRLRENDMYARRYGEPSYFETARALAALAEDLGTHPATLAVAWVARHAGPTLPILSARNSAQLAPSLAALDFEMTEALYARLSALSPTPPPATDRTDET